MTPFHCEFLPHLLKISNQKYTIILGTLALVLSSSSALAAPSGIKKRPPSSPAYEQRKEVTASGTPIFGLIGLTASDPSIEPRVASSSRMGLFLGIGTEFSLSDWASFQPELNYVQKGMEQTEGTVTSKYSYNNVELPLLLKAKYKGGDINPFLLTGPVFGWNVSSKKTTSTATGTSTQNLGSTTENAEFSWTVGVGAEVPLYDDGQSLLAQVRYEMGLTDIDPGTYAWKNRVFQFLLGYQMTF